RWSCFIGTSCDISSCSRAWPSSPTARHSCSSMTSTTFARVTKPGPRLLSQNREGSNLWIKVGTIRHRSRWYIFGDPPYGMKLGDDAEEIDLDVTLEKYDLTKRFLVKILENF